MMRAMNELALLRQQLKERLLPPDFLPVELARIRQAAVTILLREQREKAEILIIKRADHPNDPWSGHLALPGGRADESDPHLLATAARETWEEVGIKLDYENHYVGRLETLLPVNPRLPKIEITPMIAITTQEVTLELSDEVANAFWMPVQSLRESGLSDVFRFKTPEAILKYPAYPSPFGPIWGITQRILTEFLSFVE